MAMVFIMFVTNKAKIRLLKERRKRSHMNVFHEFQFNDTAYLSVIGLPNESSFTLVYSRILWKLYSNYKSYEIRIVIGKFKSFQFGLKYFFALSELSRFLCFYLYTLFYVI